MALGLNVEELSLEALLGGVTAAEELLGEDVESDMMLLQTSDEFMEGMETPLTSMAVFGEDGPGTAATVEPRTKRLAKATVASASPTGAASSTMTLKGNTAAITVKTETLPYSVLAALESDDDEDDDEHDDEDDDDDHDDAQERGGLEDSRMRAGSISSSSSMAGDHMGVELRKVLTDEEFESIVEMTVEGTSSDGRDEDWGPAAAAMVKCSPAVTPGRPTSHSLSFGIGLDEAELEDIRTVSAATAGREDGPRGRKRKASSRRTGSSRGANNDEAGAGTFVVNPTPRRKLVKVEPIVAPTAVSRRTGPKSSSVSSRAAGASPALTTSARAALAPVGLERNTRFADSSAACGASEAAPALARQGSKDSTASAGSSTSSSSSSSSSKKTARRWTPEQDEELRDAVSKHKGQNWKAIARMVQDRDHVQCLQRWKKVLQPGLVKGMWSKEEDDLLLQLMCTSQPKNWADIAAKVPGRTAKQCRERWSLNLDPSINRGAWTQTEDEMLLELHERLGNRWAEIKRHLKGRTENGVKTRFKSLERARQKDKEVSWTDELERQLHDIVVRFDCRIDDVAKHLPRALRGISSQAMRDHCRLLRDAEARRERSGPLKNKVAFKVPSTNPLVNKK